MPYLKLLNKAYHFLASGTAKLSKKAFNLRLNCTVFNLSYISNLRDLTPLDIQWIKKSRLLSLF